MDNNDSDLKELIDEDVDWLKKELETLTNEERCFILDEYIERTGDYGIGIMEYKAFIDVFNEMEE